LIIFIYTKTFFVKLRLNPFGEGKGLTSIFNLNFSSFLSNNFNFVLTIKRKEIVENFYILKINK